MTFILQAAIIFAALVFIAVSGIMNALFLSSLGRTPVEVSLLAAVSIAADISKAALPVILARAIILRAIGQIIAVAVLLCFVVLLSLASGTGFAAMTRGAVTSARDAQHEKLNRLQRDMDDTEAQIAALSVSRALAAIEAEQAATAIDRRWQASKSCTDVNGAALRQFCNEVFKLQAEFGTARARERLTKERARIGILIETLQKDGAGADSDPQSSAIAELLGVDKRLPRVALTSSIAFILEIGSIFLVLLAAGPTLRGWREPGSEPKPEPVPATLPVQADRSHWHRQRDKTRLGVFERADGHAGQ